MASDFFRWRSLKVRITAMVLGGFVFSIWILALVTSAEMDRDLQALVGAQQLSTAKVVAQDLNNQVVGRIKALESVASEIQARHMAAPHSLQKLFSERPLLQQMFSGGTFVTDAQGTVIASVPLDVGRVGVNYAERDHVAFALKRGKARVSDPVVGKMLQVPVVSIAVPIFGAQGAVIGTLVGVTKLSQSNYIADAIDRQFSKNGSYLLVDIHDRQIVVATDQRLNMTALQSPGVSALTDAYLKGLEHHGVLVGAQGVALMSAAHGVAAARWVVIALQPLEDALAPLRSMQRNMLVTALLLTLLAAGLTLLMLMRVLAPVRTAVDMLSGLRSSQRFPDALPLPGVAELDEVVLGFNHVLDSLRLKDQTLRASQAMLQDSQVIAGVGSYVVTAEDGTWTSSGVLREIFGINPDYPHTIAGWEALVHSDDRQRMTDYFAALLTARADRFVNTYRIVRRKDGVVRWMHGLGWLEFAPGGTFLGMRGAIQDITETVESDQRLRKLSSITEQAPMAIVITDLRGTVEYVNPAFTAVTGYSVSELVGRNPRTLQSGKTPPEVYVDMWATLLKGEVWRGNLHNRKKSGENFIERAVIAPVFDADGIATHYVALKEDITEHMQRQNELQASLQEKTALLNEVHHRVKNNLQVVTSLLRLEAGRADNAHTESVLVEMQGRIRSMALVHETLYRSGTFASVDLHSYIQQVATAAFRAQVRNTGAVRLVFDLEPVRASLDQATPCGLLVNELVSNCLKHAFAPGARGELCIALKPVATDASAAAVGTAAGQNPRWCLRVSDTGAGLPADFEARREQSLGLQLVSDLTGQLHGSLTIEAGPGASFAVCFPIASA